MVVPTHSYTSDDESSSISVPQESVKTSVRYIDIRRTRTVRFCEEVNVQIIPNRRHFSKKERECMYFTKAEKDKIKWELRNSLQRVTRGQATLHTIHTNTDNTLNDDDSDADEEMRGLEIYEPCAHRERRKRIDYAVKVLLREQAVSGSIRESWLDYVYQDLTAVCVRAAHMRGIMDQQVHTAAPPPVQLMIR